jgi:hypothetical protein
MVKTLIAILALTTISFAELEFKKEWNFNAETLNKINSEEQTIRSQMKTLCNGKEYFISLNKLSKTKLQIVAACKNINSIESVDFEMIKAN